ncbi:MAG: hypothetical protein ACO4AU_01355 [bacterium]|jgi:hypothetical protein
MSSLSVTLPDDRGCDCRIRNILTFHRHLQEFHATGVSIHDEDGHYFTVDEAFRNKIQQLAQQAQG